MHFPWRNTLLMMILSGCSQSDIGDINPENWSNSTIKPSSSVGSQTESWLDGSFSHTITACMTSFTDSFDGCVLSGWVPGFFMKLCLSPNLPKKHLMELILTEISLLDPISWQVWNDSVLIGNIFLLICCYQIYLFLDLFWAIGAMQVRQGLYAPVSRRVIVVGTEALGASLGETTTGANLGGSSKYSRGPCLKNKGLKW